MIFRTPEPLAEITRSRYTPSALPPILISALGEFTGQEYIFSPTRFMTSISEILASDRTVKMPALGLGWIVMTGIADAVVTAVTV